jgi:hypothetical protein
VDDGTRPDDALHRHGVPSERIRLLPAGSDPAWSARRADMERDLLERLAASGS